MVGFISLLILFVGLAPAVAAERTAGKWVLSSGRDFETGTLRRAYTKELNLRQSDLHLNQCIGPVLPFVLSIDDAFLSKADLKVAENWLVSWLSTQDGNIPILLSGGMDGYYFDIIDRLSDRPLSNFFDGSRLGTCKIMPV